MYKEYWLDDYLEIILDRSLEEDKVEWIDIDEAEYDQLIEEYNKYIRKRDNKDGKFWG